MGDTDEPKIESKTRGTPRDDTATRRSTPSIDLPSARSTADGPRPADSGIHTTETPQPSTSPESDPEAIATHIDELRRDDNIPAAQDLAEHGLRLFPTNPRLLIAQARVYLAQYRIEQALDNCQRAATIAPDNETALAWRIACTSRLRRFEDAQALGHDACARLPHSALVRVAFSRVHIDQYRYAPALELLEEALTIDPRHASALEWRVTALRELRRFTDAETAASEAIALRPDDPDLLVELGFVFDDQYDYERALETYQRALTIDPRHASALEWRVTALRALRRFTDAETAVKDAIALRPDSPDLLVELGWIFDDQYDYKRALETYRRALTIDPRHETALRWQIRALRRRRQFVEAETAAGEAVALRPDDPGLLVELGFVFQDRYDYERALDAYRRALTIDPRHETALRWHIRALHRCRQFVEAETAAREAIALRPDSPNLLVELGWISDDQYDYQAALGCYREALQVKPRHLTALEEVVTALRRLGRFDEALIEGRHAITIAPFAGGLLVELGRVLDDRLDFRQALVQFDAARQLNSRDPNAALGRSSVLRSLRRYTDAERDITQLLRQQPYRRSLRVELGWIQHDARRLTEAEHTFRLLLAESVSVQEEATALRGLGWVAFTAANFPQAEAHFREAHRKQPDDHDHQLDLAWALTRHDDPTRWAEAQELCLAVLEENPHNPTAHVCLGVLAFQRGDLPASEHHLTTALDLNPYHGSHCDLGALYVQLGRHDEAIRHLSQAADQDWYNTQPHVELGNLHLQTDKPHDAALHFRRALAIDPTSTTATLGLAQALSALDDETNAEAALRAALHHDHTEQGWQLHAALARLLLQRGDKLQSGGLYAEAYAHAQHAIETAPNHQADPHFVAAIAHYKLGALTTDLRGSAGYRSRALKHLQHCLDRDHGHVEAQRTRQLLEREHATARAANRGGLVVAIVAIGLLGVLWSTFFATNRVTPVMVTTITPVLVGLVAVAVLLPSLIKLKLPGFEADLDAGLNRLPSGPTGDVTFGPGKFTVTTGPTGQLPRRD